MHKETLSKKTRIVLEKIVPVARPFYLAGGTALALELGHRISVDLDFFSKDTFSVSSLVLKLNTLGKLKIEDQSEDTFNGSLDGVKISFFYYPYPLIFPTREYSNVVLADERDIGAMKVQAISGRGSKKDFVDIFVLLKKYSLKELLGFFHKKYEKFNYNQLHILKSLRYFYDADTNPEPIYIHPISWDEVKNFIKNIVDEYLKSQS
ncbi:nucleotidyl transferase AbiEii/AbiGii toxin family protein [Candidatus Nomurabacteria bacterium]|nr:nucleotidyl transferase AbiEii/AbiGii toxin family protein [Candidatus Nomurabacteria bacterium]